VVTVRRFPEGVAFLPEDAPVASLRKIGDTYFVSFRFGGRNGRQFRRSLGTDRAEAEARRKRIEAMLHDLNTGRVQVPEGVDLGMFILSDGRLAARQVAAAGVTLGEGFELYLRSTAFQKKAGTTRVTERVHTRTISRLLKKATPVASLTSRDLQRYIDLRKRGKGIRGERVKPRTIQKELATLSVIWNDFFKPQGIVRVRFGARFDDKLSYEKEPEKPPFDTYENIARKVARGGLSESEVLDLWDCLYLDEGQLAEVLAVIQCRRDCPAWLYPAAVAVAHTGCRRSEMMRAEVDDFDFSAGVVHWREKKKNHKKEFTFRHVVMSSLVRRVVGGHVAEHPGGQLAFCERPGERLTPKVAHGALRVALSSTSALPMGLTP
jgi:integrase